MIVVKFSDPLCGMVERSIFIKELRSGSFNSWIVGGIDSREENKKSWRKVENKNNQTS